MNGMPKKTTKHLVTYNPAIMYPNNKAKITLLFFMKVLPLLSER